MMFKINLATRIYINTGLVRLYASAAVIVMLAVLFLNARIMATRAGEMKNLAGQVATMENKLNTAHKGMTEQGYKTLLARINFANATIERKTYNWLTLLDKLELVVPDGVSISSIEPDPKNQALLKLTGVARSFKNLRTFMEHLEDSQFFTEVYLMNEGDTKLGDATQGISFGLTCKVISK